MVDYDTSRGPYHAILDKMALARQAQTGESYAKAYTEVYTDPANAAIRDGAAYDHLAKAFDSVHGTAKSLVPVAAAAAPASPLEAQESVAKSLGPAHAQLHRMALEHQRAHPELTYAQSYARLYSSPETGELRARMKAEQAGAAIRTLSIEEAQTLEPAKPFPPYGHPGDRGAASPIGRIGRLPAGYVGG